MSSDLVNKICLETGCSRSTVYRALKGSELVGKATRKRIQASASKIGLRFNPLVGEWMAHVRNSKNQLSRVPLLYLCGVPDEIYATEPFFSNTWKGARECAAELGFSIIRRYIDGNSGPDQWKEIGEDLCRQKIRGVVISRFPPNAKPVNLPWESISCVAIGFSASRPAMHTVTSHGFETIRYCLDLLKKRGYERPGWVCSDFAECLGGGRHTANFLAARHVFTHAGEVPIFRVSIEARRDEDRVAFLDWYHRYRPDVILSGGIREYHDWLLEAGVDIPKETGFFFVGLRQKHIGFSGIWQPSDRLGRSAVEMLGTLIYHGDRGLPKRANIIQTFNPVFNEGATIRPSVL
jgi:DNA-binding LacI/PurR family transcriptional regulator